MAKPEFEFYDTNRVEWEPATGIREGLFIKILSQDPETGAYTRLLRWEPGDEISERLVHDFWEEIYILEGRILDLSNNQEYTAGMYACRPPGMLHGPARALEPTLMFEVTYYTK
jgi:hypothetical protein